MTVAAHGQTDTRTELKDCFFYHTMEIPAYGVVPGLWDLRGGTADYLGRVNFSGKRVLEFGPANGFLTFEMEALGANIVCCELSEDQPWDVVPYAGIDVQRELAARREHLRRLNNAFWLAHELLDSEATVIYSRAYDFPSDVGPFDIALFGSILLHLRDPFLALQRGLAVTTETVIVTDMRTRYDLRFAQALKGLLPRKLRRPGMHFIPDYGTGFPRDTWWRLNPEIVVQFLGILGFEETTVTCHTQLFKGRRLPLFTVVGRRTKGLPTGEIRASCEP